MRAKLKLDRPMSSPVQMPFGNTAWHKPALHIPQDILHADVLRAMCVCQLLICIVSCSHVGVATDKLLMCGLLLAQQ